MSLTIAQEPITLGSQRPETAAGERGFEGSHNRPAADEGASGRGGANGVGGSGAQLTQREDRARCLVANLG